LRTSTCVFGGFLLILSLSGTARAQDEREPSADAPYQIARSTRNEVRVDIGRLKGRSRRLRVATVLTPAGPVLASFVRTRRVCADMGEDLVCHYEAVLRASRPMTKPIAVLAGRRAVSETSRLRLGPEQPIGNADPWLDAGISVSGGTYQWKRSPDGVFLTFNGDREFYSPSINLASCTQSRVDIFTVVTCGNESQLLYQGRHGILTSFAEYAEAAAQPLLRFRLGGKEALLIRIGLKGQVVIGMFVKEHDHWRLEIRGADYALLC
jgi:hypothetical protein